MKFTPSTVPDKINWGVMKEVPEISINRFKASCIHEEKVKAFFMTHYDDDLVSQVLSTEFLEALLDTPENSCRLYLHKEVHNYLKYYMKTLQFPNEDRARVAILLEEIERSEKFVFLEINLPAQILFPRNKLIQVTALSSGYDVGCVMLLIEVFRDGNTKYDEPKRILYSGNCRLTSKDMEKLQPLFHDNEMCEPKHICMAYLDTTFCLNEVQELPPRGKVMFELISEIKKMLNEDPQMRIEFETECKGGMSRFFQHVADEFCQAVHAPATLSEYWSKIDPVIGARVTCLSDEEREVHSNFHYDCGEEHDYENCVGPREDWGITHDASRIILGSYSATKSSFERAEGQPFWTNGSPTIVQKSSTDKVALYFNHMSRFELGRFINSLNLDPALVVPLYRPQSMTTQQVKDLIQNTCESVTTEPSFIRREIPNCWFDLSNKNKMPARNTTSESNNPILYLHTE